MRLVWAEEAERWLPDLRPDEIHVVFGAADKATHTHIHTHARTRTHTNTHARTHARTRARAHARL